MTDSISEEQALNMIMDVFESVEEDEWMTEKQIHHRLQGKVSHILLDHYLAILCANPKGESEGKPRLVKKGGSSKPGTNEYARNV